MVAIVGGVLNSEKEYSKILKEKNKKCKILNTMCPNFKNKIENCEACIVFTNVVSHKMLISCSSICKKNNIKMIHLTSKGTTNLKKALDSLL
ncbi:MAG: DUF2325 domain-containing protein [Fusobacteriaceae bacterium]